MMPVVAEGFLCHERREKGKRVAFDLVTLDGKNRGTLASVDGPATGEMVGKYHVQVLDLEALAFPAIDDMFDSSAGSWAYSVGA